MLQNIKLLALPSPKESSDLISLPTNPARPDRSQVAINGIACRLPGAADEAAFWQLLVDERCAVGPLPAGRWRAERFFHPDKSQPGFSYTFAGGYIDDPLGFDPAVFGISPREAAEIDPQQRLLLDVVWGALENAGIPPSALAGTEVGVYVGASSLDYGNLHTTDPAAIESHFMTGNTLSVLSNRISYIFDFHGPSFTIDTACSSSLVAFAEAQAAIASGRIDVAIVAGVNLLLSPTSFIGFSRASMLSPTGLCRPFAAAADGYVRAEGAVAMVLTRRDVAIERGYKVRAVALASGINSDGRTSGISLPAMEGQRALLERIYGEAGIDPARLSFAEAHGTGTAVGDPAEATAIGEALGQKRADILPIGSVKSNIGHLEPASGLAGMFKAILAMEHRLLPRTLHTETLNQAIDFGALNLAVATKAVPLAATGTLHAGISSFGFGGTNAHVVLRAAEGIETAVASPAAPDTAAVLMLSAHSKAALAATAAAFADFMVTSDIAPARIANAVAWQRDLAGHRLALPVDSSIAMAQALRHFAQTGSNPAIATGTAPAAPPRLCFVFSGNGCQWAGMGRTAYQRAAAFRQRFDAIDAAFQPLAGWSLVDALHDPDLAARLKFTRIAQPMLFAVQASLTAALAAAGIAPDMVLGHSVGEVAAAEAAGAISLAQAVHIIYHRSQQQEDVHGLGTMAVASLSHDAATTLIAEAGFTGLEVAASNSPTSVTLSGDEATIRRFVRFAQKRRIATRVLDLAYPFHSGLLAPIRAPLLEALGTIAASSTTTGFISTVTGEVMAGDRLDAEYWWHNVREPVRFRDAITAAARQGGTLFIEIGPRPILGNNITDTLRDIGADGTVLASLVEEKNGALPGDPLTAILARALVAGARFDAERVFGAPTAHRVALPSYAWQRRQFPHNHTAEALDFYGTTPLHPLIGSRLQTGGTEWRHLLDATIVPYLADHRIDDEIIVPGTGFAEMALAVARETWPEGPIALEDFDLLQWLPLQAGQMREISVRLAGDTGIVEIWSRPRHAGDEWTLHARGRITRPASAPPAFVAPTELPHHMTAERVYASASDAGVDYGPSFRRVLAARRDDKIIEIDLAPIEASAGAFTRPHILHPVALDAAFHALFENIKLRQGERYAYLPVRFANLRIDQDDAIPARARVVVDRETDHSLSIAATLYAADHSVIATLTGGLFRAVVFDRRKAAPALFHQTAIRLERFAAGTALYQDAVAALQDQVLTERPESWQILEAFARALAHQALAVRSETQPPSPLAASLYAGLQAAGLATNTGDRWTLASETGLPAATLILEAFAAEHAGATPEIVLGAQALRSLPAAIATGARAVVSASIIDQFETDSILAAPLHQAALALVSRLAGRTAPDPLRLLIGEPGSMGLLHALLPLIRAQRATVTIAGTDGKRLRHLQARRGTLDGIDILDLTETDDAPIETRYDLALAFAGAITDDAALARGLAARIDPAGLIAVLQPTDSIMLDVLLGATDAGAPRSVSRHDASRALLHAGCHAIEPYPTGAGTGTILLARPDAVATAAAAAAPPAVLIGHAALFDALTQTIHAQGRTVRSIAADPAGFGAACASIAAAHPDQTIDYVFTAADRSLEANIDHLAALLGATAALPTRLWLVVSGLDGSDPAAEALWCFARVAVNEYPDITLRLIDLAPGLAPDSAAPHLAALLAAPGTEAELLIDATGITAIRLANGVTTGQASHQVEAARLELPAKGVLSQFDWVPATRTAPAAHEVEVEIAAAGLNFRDVMLATGLLDDDVLDDGLAGAVFGFECAGRVVRAGSAVTTLQPGDAVMGFGRQSFATHTTADARVFTRLPEGMAVEASTSIPVAFLTAWYGLVHLAQLREGETVLIHGAAGGVGIAAMQIARARGARIIATVSSPDKRALATLFGAELIFNSRSTAFADDIRDAIGGVDVVLNSLAGDAMLASLKCLKPFGRFIELGKRDYVANTALGLRPFRRNLTYFGVDLDQLLAANLPLTQALMQDIVAGFERGDFCPLPYRAFDAPAAAEAFQSMQSGLHIGKLLVRPPSPPMATTAPVHRFEPAAGVHLVVGGTSGFGFETAAWLAEQGARTIVLASRRGTLEPALQARAEAMTSLGTTILVEPLDATDQAAVTALIARLTADHGRIAGIIHAAMVLDDGLIANLAPARTRAVLAPKITGAAHLDHATRDHALDYFVAYSSATTMIGNPGQSAYVAANGYLQGLMRNRRARGLPGLAVAWGAIADAGVLARDQDTAAKLERISGIAAMRAREALGYLGGLLAAGNAVPATVYCATIRPNGMLRALKLLQTPSFAGLFTAADSISADAGLDLAGMIAGKPDAEARALVAALVAAEVARILRLAAEDIDPARRLDELGMDSLMSIELRMGIETRFGVELPVVAINSGVSVNDLAARLIAGAAATTADAPAGLGDAERRLLMQHGARDIGVSELMAVNEAIEAQRSTAGTLL
ncbi:Acyl transferase domain-containing protein [Acidiphilium rubrum]|uniref:Acyl transferase domain-containing protein n=2 Tax=Acidiphilium TaxID=522 RepID=A0A8G2FE91_ACIRU|nr:Acyl transferase domain-containing protein [Acidiphilium rubrum]